MLHVSRATRLLGTQATFWAGKAWVPYTPHVSHCHLQTPRWAPREGPGRDSHPRTACEGPAPGGAQPRAVGGGPAAPRGPAPPVWVVHNRALFVVSQGFLGPVRTGLIYALRFPLREAAAGL